MMATRRGRLRGTSVPAGEQPPSQLPSFLCDTHLLYTQRAPPYTHTPPTTPLSRVTHPTHGNEPVSPTGPKARIRLEKNKSFRGVCMSAVPVQWEIVCLARRVVSTEASSLFQPAIMSSVFCPMCYVSARTISDSI